MKREESETDEELHADDSGANGANGSAESSNDDGDEVTDNIGDASVEINVEQLISELELQSMERQVDREAAARKRLEELMEQRRARRELEDFEDYEI